MPVSPARLRAAAESVRAVARRLRLDVEPLVALGDRHTWEGPASDAYRSGAGEAKQRAEVIAISLERVAARLESEADRLAAEAVAAARLAEEQERFRSQQIELRLQQTAELRRERWLASQGAAGLIVGSDRPVSGPVGAGTWFSPELADG